MLISPNPPMAYSIASPHYSPDDLAQARAELDRAYYWYRGWERSYNVHRVAIKQGNLYLPDKQTPRISFRREACIHRVGEAYIRARECGALNPKLYQR